MTSVTSTHNTRPVYTSSRSVSSSIRTLSCDSLGRELLKASKYGDEGYISTVINSTRFRDVSLLYLEWSFEKASKCGHVSCLHSIMSSYRFEEVSPVSLGKGFLNSIKGGHISCLNLLITSIRFNDISSKILEEGVAEMVMRGYSNLLEVVSKSSKFQTISVERLNFVFGKAVQKGDSNSLHVLVRCSLFNKIIPECLTWSLYYAKNHSKVDCLHVLIGSGRLHEMHSSVLDYISDSNSKMKHYISLALLLYDEQNTKISHPRFDGIKHKLNSMIVDGTKTYRSFYQDQLKKQTIVTVFENMRLDKRLFPTLQTTLKEMAVLNHIGDYVGVERLYLSIAP